MKKNLLFLLLISIKIQAVTININKRFYNFGNLSFNTTSVVKKVSVDFPITTQAFTIVTAAPFEISFDSLNFNTNFSLGTNASAVTKNIWVRYKPTVADVVDRQKIYFIYGATDTNSIRVSLYGSSYPVDSFYSVASMNTMWFGKPSGCSCDTALQFANTSSFINELQPDIMGLQEVTENTYLNRIKNLLGSNYDAKLATYCSLALDTSNGNYKNNQKTAYLFNQNKFTFLQTFGLAYSTSNYKSTTSAYHYFSSGRYPMVLKLIEKTGNDTIYFMNIHAKALNDTDSYNRRVGGAHIIADSVNAQYANQKVLLTGDYNDQLDTSITPGFPSPYIYLVNTAMQGISLPSLYVGQTTYVTIANSIIDNFCANTKMINDYANGSYTILNELTSVFTNYTTTTSDHYPVIAYFKKYPKATAIADVPNNNFNNQLAITATENYVQLSFLENPTSNYVVRMYNLNGQLLFNQQFTINDSKVEIPCSNISGMYFVNMAMVNQHKTIKIVK